MSRQFNVYSEQIVVYPNETFDWILDSAEASSVAVNETDTWPLSSTSYTVNAGTPTSATVGDSPGVTASFQCVPAATSVTSQTIIVASQGLIDPCDDVEVYPGDWFIWQNDTSVTLRVTPSEGNSAFWPLPSQMHEVPPNGTLALQIPTDAEANTYTLVVTTDDGGGACDDAGQPKIIVKSPG